MAFYMKKHDTLPAFRAVLTQSDGESAQVAVDLTTATAVRFIMSKDGIPKVVEDATIVDPTSGLVEYDWNAVDTSQSGVFDAEFEVAWGSERQTFPSDSWLTITIVDDLA